MKTEFQIYFESLEIGFHSILIKDYWMKIEKTKKSKLKLWQKNKISNVLVLFCFIKEIQKDNIICKTTSIFEINRNQIKVKQLDGTYKIIEY